MRRSRKEVCMSTSTSMLKALFIVVPASYFIFQNKKLKIFAVVLTVILLLVGVCDFE